MTPGPTPGGVALSLAEVEAVTRAALSSSGVAAPALEPLVASVVAAEADGIHSHGLARLPTYCEHARCGKIDGRAVPVMDRPRAGLVRVDARDGFAHPAIALGLPALAEAARGQGIAALAVANSYNCGVVGHHVEAIARAGLLALGFVNAPASMAPFGGRRPVFGTNPIALAVPRGKGEAPLVLDQSSSTVAKSELIVHQQRGEPIPLGWAIDAEGQPTTDPAAGLAGSMLPAGGYKGAGQALIVELMAAWLTGAHLSLEAGSFADNKGGSPRTGQCFLAIDPGPLAGPAAAERLARLFGAIEGQEGARLPGSRRAEARARTATEGITIPAALHARLLGYAAG